MDLALNPSWGNTAENVSKVVVPKGMVIYEGTAAPQVIKDSLGNAIGNLPGGGNSIYTESRSGVVSMMMCDCEERIGIGIDSYKLFEELKDFFEIQVKLKIYSEVKVSTPYYIGYDIEGGQMEWYADKWYKCNYCGVLWEFRYPDFPAEGFVRKFEDGVYHTKD